LRDLGLALGAFALARLAAECDQTPVTAENRYHRHGAFSRGVVGHFDWSSKECRNVQ